MQGLRYPASSAPHGAVRSITGQGPPQEKQVSAQRWRLDGQTALITGASAGIGLAIARELAGFGADLLIVGRDPDALEMARDELVDAFPDREIHGLAADVSDDEDRREILDWVEDHSDGLHLLINNAGGNITSRPPNTPKTNGAASSRPTCSRLSSCRATRTRCWPGTPPRRSSTWAACPV